MKKTISILLATTLLFSLAGCNPTPTPEVRYEYTFGMYNGIEHFASLEELHKFLSSISDEKLETIRERENRYIENTSKKLKLSEAELEYGVFGDFHKTFLESETFMFPHYIDNPLPQGDPLTHGYIQIFEFGSFNRIYPKTWISVFGEIDEDVYISVALASIDPALIDEANEKGASWLLSERETDGLNVYNYQEINKALLERYMQMDKDPENEFTLREQERMNLQNMKVYEKTYHLGDRDVLAMVIDRREDDAESSIALDAYFVYDDMLINVIGHHETIEAALPHLTFREIHMPTGEPVRDTPGRDWSEGGEDEE